MVLHGIFWGAVIGDFKVFQSEPYKAIFSSRLEIDNSMEESHINAKAYDEDEDCSGGEDVKEENLSALLCCLR